MKSTILTAASVAAALAMGAPAANAQTNPELVDLPAYLAYVASHPTRPFQVDVPGAGATLSGAIVSPVNHGGSVVLAYIDKYPHTLIAGAGLGRDPRKINSLDDFQTAVDYRYGNEFRAANAYYNGTLQTYVYQAKIGGFHESVDLGEGPGAEKRIWLVASSAVNSDTYLTPEELAQGNTENLNSNTQLNGGAQELVIENGAGGTYSESISTDENEIENTTTETTNSRTRRLAYTDYNNDIGVDAHYNNGDSTTVLERKRDTGALITRNVTEGFSSDKGASVHVQDIFYANLSDQESGLNRVRNPAGREPDNDLIIDRQDREVAVGLKNVTSADYQQHKYYREVRHDVKNDEGWGHLDVSVANTSVVDLDHAPHDPLSEDEPLAYQLNAPVPLSGELDLDRLAEGELPAGLGFMELKNGQHSLKTSVLGGQTGVVYEYGREFAVGAVVNDDLSGGFVGIEQTKIGLTKLELDTVDTRADLILPEQTAISADVFNAHGRGLVILNITPPGGGTLIVPVLPGAPASPVSTVNFIRNFAP